MRYLIKRILGIDTLDKTLTESNKATQKRLENIAKLLESNTETHSKLEDISKLDFLY